MVLIRIITFWGLALLAATAQAQTPSFVASATAVVTAASVTISRPAGVAQSDVLIAQITVKGGVTVSAPGAAGDWNLIDVTSTSGSDMTQAVFWRRAGAIGSEPASYAFSFSASGRAIGAVAAYRNVDPIGSPLDAAGVRSANGAASITLPTITTTQPNALLVALLGSSRAANTHGIPTAMTVEEYELDTGAGPNGVNASLDEQVQASAGSSGAKTASMGASTDYVAHLLALRPKPTLARYAISVSSLTVATCDYVQITVTGVDASGNLVPPPAGRSLSLATAPASGAWQAGTVTGTGGWTPSGSTATYLWPGSETSFSVRLRQYSAATLNINLNDGSGIVEDPTADPNISFVDSAFRISNGAGALLPIATQISGKSSNTGFGAQTLYLQAVSGGAGACGTLLPANTDVTIQVGAQCNNPASCSRSVTLASTALTNNTATFVPDGGFPTTMNFRFSTANSEAPFALNYPDAGQITLQFRVQITGSSPAQYVQGTSNAFVVRPFGFAFSGVSHDATPSGTAAAFAAGDNFSMTLGAYLWAASHDLDNNGVPDSGKIITGNGVTPNFAATTTVGVPIGGNLAGADGAITRAGGAPTIAPAEWSGGTAVISNWRYSEVGNVRLTAAADDYLGDASADIRGDSSNDGAVATIGRFRPKQFVVSAASLATRLAAACAPASSFTYMNERLKLTFTLTAQNTQGGTTANYNGTYAKLVLTNFSSWNLGARNGATDLSARLENPGVAAPPTGSWVNGVASGVTVTTALRRALAPDNPDGPYTALKFGIAPIDSDLTAMNTLDLGTRKDLGLPADAEVRYGRLRMDNALGSEAHRLAMPMRVEYWNGTGFATNLADSCTSLGRSAIAMAFTPPSNLASCETALDVDPVTFTQGVAKVGLTAPGAGNSGSVVLTANLGSAGGSYCNPGSFVAASSAPLSYLLGRWNSSDDDADANTAYDDKPSARAAFGLYGSQPGNFIYFRESYQ